MSDYIVDSADLTSVANAIRTKGGTSAQLPFPAGFVDAVQAIPTGSGGYTTGTFTPSSRTYTVTINTGLAEVHGILIMPESASPYVGGGRNVYVSVSNFLTNGRVKSCICYSNSAGTSSEKFIIYSQADSINYATRSGSEVVVGTTSITSYGAYTTIAYRWYAW